MKRKIIAIDEKLCTGCGLCIPNCPEGAIQLIDGKARLVSDLFCDGLGACLGECPVGAISVEEREARPYDERLVMENIVRQGANVIKAHLLHLREHGQSEYLGQALDFLEERGAANPIAGLNAQACAGPGPAACPGTLARMFQPRPEPAAAETGGGSPSKLTHWPVQLRLVSPLAPQYKEQDVLLCADCVAYAAGDFHRDFLKGKSLAIACPKLDGNHEAYIEKIRSLIDDARIKSLTVAIMEVPCCRGLLQMAELALGAASRKPPLKVVTVGLNGDIINEKPA